MPSDANGVYTLPPGYLAVTGTTVQPSQHNPPLEDIAAAISGRLMTSGAAPMTGALKLTNGTQNAPSLAFQSSQNTGFYKTAAGIGVSVGGVFVAEFNGFGLLNSTRFLGEVIAYAGRDPPALCVFAYGQTLSRTTYANLWAFAQLDIAAGGIFYNNGDGATTFGIGDLRGRVIAGRDNMGGVAAGRLSGLVVGSQQGATGGIEFFALTVANMPANIPVSITSGSFSGTTDATKPIVWDTGGIDSSNAGGGTHGQFHDPSAVHETAGISVSGNTLTGSGTASGSGIAHSNLQPTIIVNYVLFAGA